MPRRVFTGADVAVCCSSVSGSVLSHRKGENEWRCVDVFALVLTSTLVFGGMGLSSMRMKGWIVLCCFTVGVGCEDLVGLACLVHPLHEHESIVRCHWSDPPVPLVHRSLIEGKDVHSEYPRR
jgi:hypothetical protein